MKVYITFGQIHAHRVNGKTLDRDCVAVLNAENLDEGHAMAMELFDAKFHQSLSSPPNMMFYPRGLIEI